MSMTLTYFFSLLGKVWKPKDPVKEVKDDDDVETEWDDVLAQATEEELVDLAGTLFLYAQKTTKNCLTILMKYRQRKHSQENI